MTSLEMGLSLGATAVIAIVGIVATVYAPIRHERRRWQHERREALRGERAVAYSRLLSSVEQAFSAAHGFAGRRGGPVLLALSPPIRNLQLSQGEEVAATARDTARQLALVRLVGSEAVVQQAESLVAILEDVGLCIDERDSSTERWSPLLELLRERREQFLVAARHDVGEAHQ